MVGRQRFLAVGASALAFPSVAAAQSQTRLTIGTTPIDAAMGVVVAQRAGFFRKYGLDADIVAQGMGAANVAAVAGGSMQIAGSNLVTLIKAHLHGLPFQIVAPGSLYVTERPNEVLLVRKDAAIRTAADLSGKTIASPAIGDLLSTATTAWIDQNGGSSSAVKMVELPPPAMMAALQGARVDAATIAEPHLSDALRSGTFRVLAKIYDVIAPRFLISAYFAMPDFINANRDLIGRFAHAELEANAFANAHPDRTARWLAAFANVELDVVKRTQREVFAEAMDPALIQVVIDAAVRIKAIDRGFDAREMISPLAVNLRR